MELVTVISILALLASLLFPLAVSSKRLAIRSSCQANLSQVGLALYMYAEDFDDVYPSAINRYTRDHPDSLPNPHPPVAEIPDLVSVLAPYAGGSPGVFRCPADMYPYQASVEEVLTSKYPSVFAYQGTSYLFSPLNYFGLPSTSMTDLTRHIAMDTLVEWHGDTLDTSLTEKTWNALFPDGHVRFISGSELR